LELEDEVELEVQEEKAIAAGEIGRVDETSTEGNSNEPQEQNGRNGADSHPEKLVSLTASHVTLATLPAEHGRKGPFIRVPHQISARANGNIGPLPSQPMHELKRAVDETTKENQAHIHQLEGEYTIEMSQQIPDKELDVNTLQKQMVQLNQENQNLSKKLEYLNSDLKTKEQYLFLAIKKLWAANSRIKDLEHALITERLTYEKNHRRVLTVDQAVDTRSNDGSDDIDLGSTSGEEYNTDMQEESEEASQYEGLSSFVPTQKRSPSALVRLGIDLEDETTATPEILAQQQSTNIRCPICNKPASSFGDQAAFYAHVNNHFPD
jgi:hypothetical protein